MRDGIIGHQPIVDFFEKIVEKKSISHAYCFVGKHLLGKRTVALRIASLLLGVDEQKVLINPDFLFIEKGINQKTGKIRKDISIDQVRKAISFLQQYALQKDGYKVVIVDNAEDLSTGASNALLKTLEEPKKRTVLFLITSDDQLLLPTIRSRCQKIYFPFVKQNILGDFLKSKGVDTELATQMSENSHGLPGLVVNWQKNPSEYEDFKSEKSRFADLFGKPFYKKIQIVDELFGDKTDHIIARDNLIRVLDIWHTELRDYLHKKFDSDLDISRWIEAENDLRLTKSLLRKNIHPRLLIENILLQLP